MVANQVNQARSNVDFNMELQQGFHVFWWFYFNTAIASDWLPLQLALSAPHFLIVKHIHARDLPGATAFRLPLDNSSAPVVITLTVIVGEV